MTPAALVTVFEYGYLVSGGGDHTTPALDPAAFEALEQMALRPQGSALLRLCVYRGQKAIQVRNYVGVLQLADGTQLEILPKVAGDGIALARRALLNMLCHLHDFRHLQSTDASIATRPMPLLEVFISQFLQSVNRLIKRGIRSEYVRQEENGSFLKGKLLVPQQLKHNLLNRQRFFTEFDEYLQNTPANRVIRTALSLVARYARVASNQRLCRELNFAFGDVPLSADVQTDLKAVRLSRGMAHYDLPLAWSRLILSGSSPLAMSGEAQAISLLFPMEAVFECYVASVLKKECHAPYRLAEQVQARSLVRHDGRDWFRLKPDLMLYCDKRPVAVMDTKWKLLDGEMANGSDKYGLSQQDFYQMFAYGQNYLAGRGEMALIYPKTELFAAMIPKPFEYNPELRVWVVPFDIHPDTPDHCRFQGPDKLQRWLMGKTCSTV